MESKRIKLISLRYSPGILSIIIAYANAFHFLGHNVTLLLDRRYQEIIDENIFEINWFKTGETHEDSSDLLIFFNASIYNHRYAQEGNNNNSKIIYVYHEPWEGLFDFLLKEGCRQAVKLFFAHYFSIKMLNISDLVIVASRYAAAIYDKNDKKYNSNVLIIPLLFCDDYGNKDAASREIDLSYIGHAVKGHGFDIFLKFIKYANSIDNSLSFEIATRTDISTNIYQDNQLKSMVKEGRLRVIHGKSLTNRQINDVYARSHCIWNMYRRTTQSAVLPKAFMFGVPIIVSELPSFTDVVIDNYNGFIIRDCSFEEMFDRIKTARERINVLEKNCRNTFLNKFYWKTNISLLQECLSILFFDKAGL